MTAPLLIGIVTAQDPQNDGVVVSFKQSGQIAGASVKILHHGAADGVRISQRPLPGVGTWGLIAFPNGDLRNGIWLGSYYPSMVDAVASGPTDFFLDYEAHWSGWWRLLNDHGEMATVFPDGTALTVNATGDIPATYRHIVGADQKQERREFTQAERVPTIPTPFTVKLATASGVTVEISPTGAITITGPTTMVITVPTVTIHGDLDVTGHVTAGFGTGDQVGLQSHTHTQGVDSHGDTEAPVNPPTPGT